MKTFLARRKRNQRYSLRSFSRDLGVNVTTLSEVLSGKRTLSKLNAKKIAETISFSEVHKQNLLANKNDKEKQRWIQIANDEFQMLSEWHHLACLNLAKLPRAKSDPRWIADRLGISLEEAKDAVACLTRLGYLSTSCEKLTRIKGSITTQNDIPSAAIRKYHKQNLFNAADAIDRYDTFQRDVSSITVPIDTKVLPEAKKLIQEFKQQMDDLLKQGNHNAVYTCAIQLFPITILKEDHRL
jgi:uncharacterized protein (TIGR02147 family)